jgi:hypothetical protein
MIVAVEIVVVMKAVEEVGMRKRSFEAHHVSLEVKVRCSRSHRSARIANPLRSLSLFKYNRKAASD